MENVLIEYNKNKDITSAGYCVSKILNIDKPLCVPLGLVCDNDVFNSDLDRQMCQYLYPNDVCKTPNMYDKMLDIVKYKSKSAPKKTKVNKKSKSRRFTKKKKINKV